jgi:hypothetical protein
LYPRLRLNSRKPLLTKCAAMLDAQIIVNLVLAAILASLGWFARQVWNAVKDLQKDVRTIEVDLPKSYVSKIDFSDTMKRIESMLQRIADKLDEKVDKP